MKNLVFVIGMVIGVAAAAKSMKIENMSADLSLRFAAGLEKYFPETENSEKGSVKIINGLVVLQIYNASNCEAGEECEEPIYVVHETELPLAQVERYNCGSRKFGMRYETQSVVKGRANHAEKITIIDSSNCPKSDRGVGYVTYSVEGRKGNAMIQFFVDDVYRQ